ncbi:MAG TPA: hypothetical protein VFO83_08925, partial [Aggregicoccus sp.]|nr:hypothetical protein [Aggregicoccus sp.]
TFDPQDRRCVRAQLTAEGRARYAAGVKALSAAEKALFAPLKKQQRDGLLAALELLREQE